jgi:hypothetical protein
MVKPKLKLKFLIDLFFCCSFMSVDNSTSLYSMPYYLKYIKSPFLSTKFNGEIKIRYFKMGNGGKFPERMKTWDQNYN